MNGLGDATWPEVESAPPPVLAVPLGATEQHGPHLPLGTDTAIAVALCEAAAPLVAGMTVAPPLPYGSSGEHAAFPGTLSIGAAATELALLELCRSASASFPRVLLVSTHGGNAAPLAAAVERLRGEGREVRGFAPRWGGDAHAGRTETSLMLAIEPERVREERPAGNAEPVSSLLPHLRERGVRAVSPRGVLGDAAGASEREGRHLLDAAAESLAAFADSWEEPGSTASAGCSL